MWVNYKVYTNQGFYIERSSSYSTLLFRAKYSTMHDADAWWCMLHDDGWQHVASRSEQWAKLWCPARCCRTPLWHRLCIGCNLWRNSATGNLSVVYWQYTCFTHIISTLSRLMKIQFWWHSGLAALFFLKKKNLYWFFIETTEYPMVPNDHVSDLLPHIALRLLKSIGPYFVEQERMANAQHLMYGSKHLEQNFFSFKTGCL